jgi:DNA-binding transcriptional LysR family regulator
MKPVVAETLDGGERTRGELDVRQLRVLKTLLSERSVSRTAAIHGLSQPAVSLTLRRFRALTGDPLLSRSGTGLALTPRALDIVALVDRILDDLAHLAGREAEFDPLTSERHVRIVAATSFGPFLVPRLIRHLRQVAPHMVLEMLPMPSMATLQQLLEAGEVDLVLAHRQPASPHLRGEKLTECRTVCMLDPSHRLARASRITMSDYLDLEHLSPNPPHGAAVSPIDGHLAELGLSRRIRASLSEYALVPFVLSGSDLVFTTAHPFADHFAALSNIRVVDAPEEFGDMPVFLFWHERVHHSTYDAWLRRLVRDMMDDAASTGPS